MTDFGEFMKRREAAARAYVTGDPVPLAEIVARDHPATFFGPGGRVVTGAGEVAATYAKDAAVFGGGETRFEVLHQAASGDVAYWVGYQHATVVMEGRPAQTMKLRVTEVFRREGTRWVMVHRHADVPAV